jgi:hypothetical protein
VSQLLKQHFDTWLTGQRFSHRRRHAGQERDAHQRVALPRRKGLHHFTGEQLEHPLRCAGGTR